MSTSFVPPAPAPAGALDRAALRAVSRLLMVVVWTSSALFGLYILAFYGRTALTGLPAQWNTVLPGLYGSGTPMANGGIGLHFAAGGLILVLGCIQLLPGLRARWPALHRWVGRSYVLAALAAGVGGLAFIVAKGTVGGAVMDVGFGLYGVLMIVSATQAWRYGYARRIETHRAWALRLFALAIGSWLYRMDYGIWLLLAHGAGHTEAFSGPFDHVMVFFFYLPNLLVVELYLRAWQTGIAPVARWAASAVMLAAALLLGVGTYFFTLHYWGPGMLGQLPG
jgi:hypothetical protein